MKTLVIGGTGELGREIVRLLLKEGHEVVFSFHQNREEARKLEELGAMAFQLDLTRPWDIKCGWDNIVYCAQISFPRLLKEEQNRFLQVDEMSPDLMQDLYKLRVEAPFLLVQKARKLFSEMGSLLFVNTLDGVKTQTVPVFYSQCQSSMKGLVESAAHELGDRRILVNQLCLGVVEGKVSKHLPRGLRDKYLKHCSFGRFMKPAEVAELVYGLITHNTYMTGHSVVADGGL